MLQANDLQVFYGGIHALKGVNLQVTKGQIVTLLGSNGAGKSTMLRAIVGLVRPRTGSITFRGEELTGLRTHDIIRRGIAVSPEGRHVFQNLTVIENLELGAYSMPAQAIAGQIEMVYSLFPRLQERRSQLAGTLSGGEQQMLALGRALMSRPELVLLDEPSLGLAPLVVREVFKIIEQANKSGATILLIEQNAMAALEIAHYGYVLESGNIVIEGDSRELMKDERVRKAYLGEE
ncbi:MAG: ABC transporter ATP-binding protein [Syntrophobacter sp.]